MEEITYRPIGIIRSPFKEPKGTAIQPGAAEGTEGKVEKIGWLEKKVSRLPSQRDDGRFMK